MKYQAKIEEFKNRIVALKNDPDNDTRKPVKGTRKCEIMVWGQENNKAMVQLKYAQQYRRMFGTYDFVDVVIFTGDLKEACQVARELKAECGLKISYQEYVESILY